VIFFWPAAGWGLSVGLPLLFVMLFFVFVFALASAVCHCFRWHPPFAFSLASANC